VSNLKSFVSSYIKRKDYFNLEHSKSAQSRKKAVANAHNLMNDADRVCSLKYATAFDSSSNERDTGMITPSVSDTLSPKKHCSSRVLIPSQSCHSQRRQLPTVDGI
jgi:hypothetical protein